MTQADSSVLDGISVFPITLESLKPYKWLIFIVGIGFFVLVCGLYLSNKPLILDAPEAIYPPVRCPGKIPHPEKDKVAFIWERHDDAFSYMIEIDCFDCEGHKNQWYSDKRQEPWRIEQDDVGLKHGTHKSTFFRNIEPDVFVFR